jgi:hypothetical protein
LLAHGRWFSPDTSASSTTKTGRHDIVEILLKVALNTKNQSINQSIIFLLISLRNIFNINGVTMLLQIIGQCDVNFMLQIKTITSVLKAEADIIV